MDTLSLRADNFLEGFHRAGKQAVGRADFLYNKDFAEDDVSHVSAISNKTKPEKSTNVYVADGDNDDSDGKFILMFRLCRRDKDDWKTSKCTQTPKLVNLNTKYITEAYIMFVKCDCIVNYIYTRV